MNVAIVGATGYGGIQAVNLLKNNKNYKISYLGGNKSSGTKWSDNFPFINLESDNLIEKISPKMPPKVHFEKGTCTQ